MKLEMRWNSFWFSPAPYFNLALFRIIIVVYQLKVLFSRRYLQKLVATESWSDAFFDPLPVIELLLSPLMGERPSVVLIHIIFWLAVASGVCGVLGICARSTFAVFAVLNIGIRGYLWCFGEWHHPECVLLIVLCFLPFTAFDKPHGIFQLLRAVAASLCASTRERVAWLQQQREDYNWYPRLVQVLLAIAYFSAGLEKLRNGGFDWVNGYTLKYYLITYGWMYRGVLDSLELAGYHYLLIVMSVGVLLWELCFPLILFIRCLSAPFLIGGVLMHFILWKLLVVNFADFVVLYFAFVPWSSLLSGSIRCGARRQAPA